MMEIKLSQGISSNRPNWADSHEPDYNFNFGSFTDRLRFLYRQLTCPKLDTNLQGEAYLEAGCKMLNYSHGHIAIYRFGELRTQANTFGIGRNRDTIVGNYEKIEIHDPFADEVLSQDKIYYRSNVAQKCVKVSSMSYNDFDVRAYMGIPIKLGQKLYGLLAFFDSQPKSEQLTPHDIETITLMAEGVARMIELQRAQQTDKSREISEFATGGIKTLEEYLHQAKMPDVFGVPGRVVEVLQRRIGTLPLAIDYIADELNLSKRTLQRRLQQQSISFAQLRDQVRFHFSIKYLIEQRQSIDSISASLDFSDRTSFTNAFKRWTGLSPSTFRKLFRDYT